MKANPNAPAVLGLEWPPLFGRSIPYDPQTARGQSFTSGPAVEVCTALDPYIFTPEASSYGFDLLGTVYRKGEEARYGSVQKTIVACNGGTLNGATLVGASIQAALSDPSDLSFVSFAAVGSKLALTFATAGLFTGKRILRLGLYYQLFCESDPLASSGFSFPTANIGLGRTAIEGATTFLNWGMINGDYDPNFGTTAGQVRYVSLGEINPCSPTGSGLTVPDRWPWSVADVQSMNTVAGDLLYVNPLFTGPGLPVLFLFYAALEVVWCEENRQAFGAKRMSNGFANFEFATNFYHNLPLRTPGGGTVLGWAKPALTDFVVEVTKADNGGPFVLPAGVGTSPTAGSYGTAPLAPTLDSFSVFAPHEGRESPRSTDDADTSAIAITRITPVYFNVTGAAVLSADTAPYVSQLNAPVYVGVNAIQEIAQRAIAAATPYTWVRFWARRFGASTLLTVTVAGQTVTIDQPTFDALPEILSGWRAVVLKFAVTPLISNLGTNVNVTFSSTDAAINRWEILGASDALAGPATYESVTSAGTFAGTRRTDADLAVNIATAAPLVTGMSAVQQTLPVTGIGLLCASPPGCIPTGVGFVQISWAATAVTGFGFYELQRADLDENTFRTIGKITSQTNPQFNDIEARVGIESYYRVRCVRADGIAGDYAPSGTGLPFTLTGDPMNTPPGVLIFSSNISPTGSIAFIDAFESAPAEEFRFPEADTRTLQRVHGRDFQTAFRPTERGGTVFDRTLLVGNTLNLNPAFTAQPGFIIGNTPPVFVSSVVNVGLGPLFTLPDPPPGTIPGDVMVAGIIAQNGGVVTTPVGWTLLQHVGTLWVYSKVALLGDLVTVWQSSNNLENWLGAAVSYRGVKNAAPVDASSGANATLTAPSVNAAQANDELVYIATAGQITPFTFVPPTGMTERVDQYAIAALEIADQLDTAAGATGTRTATPTVVGTTAQACALVALTPAPVASPIPTGAPQPPISSGATADDGFDTLRDFCWNPNLPYVCVRDDQGNRWLANVNLPSGIVKRRRGIFLANIQVVETTITPSQGDRVGVFGP